jgi:hypothetical protein
VSKGPLLLATLDGFAVEGGFDERHGPTTCFAAASHLGLCATTGDAAGLWVGYEAALDAVPALGLDGVRLTLEWARLEPRPHRIDETAVARYRDVLGHCRSLGLRTTGVVVDAAWPAWLGAEAWLLPWVGPEVLRHGSFVAERFGDLLDGLVGFARPRDLVDAGFVHAVAPPFRHGAAEDAAAARRQVDGLDAQLRERFDAAGLTVGSFTEVPVVRSPEALAILLEHAAGSSELHLRSLVRGAGPTSSATPILEWRDSGWTCELPEGVRDALTQMTGG